MLVSNLFLFFLKIPRNLLEISSLVKKKVAMIKLMHLIYKKL